MKKSKNNFVIWQHHWVGYKPTKFGTYATLEEGTEAVNRLNASPSAQWYHYSLEDRSPELVPVSSAEEKGRS